jgi:hypothetical protein
MKKCIKCGVEQPLTGYYPCITTKDGVRNVCKKCMLVASKLWNKSNPASRLESAIRWQKAHPDKKKKFHIRWRKTNPEKYKECSKRAALRRNYGLTLESYIDLLEKHGKKCAICGKNLLPTRNNTCLDHNHKTGKLRGFLCNRHNILLSVADDNPEILKLAIKYLESDGVISGYFVPKKL